MGQWKAGESGNKKGRPPMPPELRALRKLSPSYVKLLISKFALMSREQIQAFLSHGNPNAAELVVIAIFSRAIADGDANRLGFLLDRSVGKAAPEAPTLQPCTYRTTVGMDGRLWQETLEQVIDGESEA